VTATTSEETVTIPKTEYDDLRKAALKLDCLETWGVDNWECYDDAVADYRYALKSNEGN